MRFFAALVLLLTFSSFGQEGLVLDLSFEELMEIKISSVSKKEESAFRTASSVFVISQADIQKSGARLLPEILRIVPGLQVNRFNAHTWEVSARGSDGRFSNKLLVMIDGRSIYTPIFSGVYWDMHSPILEDIERIEVIRGPGAAIWGANAMNGVINIITKKSEDTEGGFLQLGAGNLEQESLFRYGFAIDEDATQFLRVFGRFANYEDLDKGSETTGNSSDANDRWNHASGGFRYDWRITAKDSLTLRSDVFTQDFKEWIGVYSATSDAHTDGYNFGLDYHKAISDDREFNLHVMHDYFSTDTVDYLDTDIGTYEVNTDYHFSLNEQHKISMGLGYKKIEAQTKDELNVIDFDLEDNYDYYSAFIQDVVTLKPDVLFLTLGTKFEYNDISHFDIQPSARLAVIPANDKTLWFAYSRAVRTPSFLENNSVVAFANGVDVDPENVDSYEVGFRHKVNERFDYDLTLFYMKYDDLIAYSGTPVATSQNLGEGESYGAELGVTYEATPAWTLKGGYTYNKVDYDFGNIGTLGKPQEPFSLYGDATTAEHKFSIRSQHYLNEDMDVNVNLYYMGAFQTQFLAKPDSSNHGYYKLDINYNWQVTRRFKLSINAYNLLNSSTAEASTVSEVPRSFFIMGTYEF